MEGLTQGEAAGGGSTSGDGGGTGAEAKPSLCNTPGAKTTLSWGAGLPVFLNTSRRDWSSSIRVNPSSLPTYFPPSLVRLQISRLSTGYSRPKSNSHQGWSRFSAVWEKEFPTEPSRSRSMAFSGTPPYAVEDWLALPRGATFLPPLLTITSTRQSAPLPGSEIWTYRQGTTAGAEEWPDQNRRRNNSRSPPAPNRISGEWNHGTARGDSPLPLPSTDDLGSEGRP